MKGPPITITLALLFGGGLVWGMVEAGIAIVQKVVAPPPAVTLNLIDLRYEDGKFVQHIEPQGADAIRAEWGAKIYRGTRWLCGAGGVGVYDGTIHAFEPDEWTGSKCPPLKPGDRASATWEWEGMDRIRRSMSASITIR